MLCRRSTDALIEDMSSGRAEPDQAAALSCLPLCDEPQSDCESDLVFEGLCQLSDLEASREADHGAISLGMWSSMSEDEVDDRDCHDTRLRHELEFFMEQSIDALAPSPPVVRPSEPASPEIPLRLPTLPPWSPRNHEAEHALPDRTAVSPRPNLLQRLLSTPAAGTDAIRKQKRERGGKRRGSGLFFQPNLFVVQRSLGVSQALSELVMQDGIPHLKRKRSLRVKFQ